jgi:hypothetical protein
MISEAVLAIEYGASSEDIARTTHAHVSFPSFSIRSHIFSLQPLYFSADTKRSVQRSGYGGVLKVNPLLD